MNFDEYILSRRYNFGRGSPEAWQFVLMAKGDEALRRVEDRRTLEQLVMARCQDPELLKGARSAWNSFQHRRWKRTVRERSFEGGELRKVQPVRR